MAHTEQRDTDDGDITPILDRIATQFGDIADTVMAQNHDTQIKFLDVNDAAFRKINTQYRRMAKVLNDIRKRQNDAIVAQQKPSSTEADADAATVAADVSATMSAALKAKGLFQ